MAREAVLAGIFVGGASRRMGGVPKGLLSAPGGSGETVIARTRRVFAACGVPSVLVGVHEAYGDLGMEVLADAGLNAGPLGGLAALLERVEGGYAVATACDMPFVTEPLVRRLLAAAPAIAVAPKRAGRWEPLFALYDAERARDVVRSRLAAGQLSLQGLLDALAAHELTLVEDEAAQLDDWDSPEDRA
jgi:molybdenum cofactor guanylyltransferase